MFKPVMHSFCSTKGNSSLRASSPIWASEASRARTREGPAKGVFLKLAFYRSEGIHVLEIHVIAVKLEPPLVSKQQRNNLYKKRPY